MSEGGFQLGSAYVSVDPDVSDFAQQLDEELGGLRLAVRVVPDMADFDAQVDEQAGGHVATVMVDADTGPAREQVAELVDTGLPRDVSFEVNAETRGAVSGLQDVTAAAEEAGAAAEKAVAGADALGGALDTVGAVGRGAAEALTATDAEIRAFAEEFGAAFNGAPGVRAGRQRSGPRRP